MIELYLQHGGILVAKEYGWDARIARDVPAENVVAVLPPDDPALAA